MWNQYSLSAYTLGDKPGQALRVVKLLGVLLLLTACDGERLFGRDETHQAMNQSAAKTTSSLPPPLDSHEVATGARVFEQHCQTCHGVAAVGQVRNWQQRDANGVLPAPPLNGSAHSWHHDQATLLETINRGGSALGGTMPAFELVLSEADKLAVLSYIKSLWPAPLYEAWWQRFEQ